jgi:hypothetical protein
MSWSLELRNGDLALSGTHLGQVTGPRKLVQDLGCAILEPRGNDDMHPTFGSTIDGGQDENGNYVTGVLGSTDWAYANLLIHSEIQRIAGEYQRRQIARARDDRTRFGESMLSNGELLVQIENIEFVQAGDTLLVTIWLLTGNNKELNLTVPIATGTLLDNA